MSLYIHSFGRGLMNKSDSHLSWADDSYEHSASYYELCEGSVAAVSLRLLKGCVIPVSFCLCDRGMAPVFISLRDSNVAPVYLGLCEWGVASLTLFLSEVARQQHCISVSVNELWTLSPFLSETAV